MNEVFFPQGENTASSIGSCFYIQHNGKARYQEVNQVLTYVHATYYSIVIKVIVCRIIFAQFDLEKVNVFLFNITPRYVQSEVRR
jgi:hypothetical protein